MGLRECLPLCIFLRNRLHYALTLQETKKILMQRLIKVDGRVRTDTTYPAGFMDVITIEKTNENFRLIYDVKGRFAIHRITAEEAKYKLCKVKKVSTGQKAVPYLVTHDARTIRYPDPDIKVHDTCVVDIATGKITSHIKFDSGMLCMITGGHNLGRVGSSCTVIVIQDLSILFMLKIHWDIPSLLDWVTCSSSDKPLTTHWYPSHAVKV